MARLFLILILLFGFAAAPQTVTAADAEQVTTNRPLQRGAIIREGDVSGPYATEDYVGQELVRSVRAGAVITPRHVRTPLQVERNDTVTLVFRRGPLTMETTGRSLGEGSEGDRVSVMNTTSRKRVTGRIIGQGLVEVTP
jgi:flagella basal body P-ring formation protein FlgA